MSVISITYAEAEATASAMSARAAGCQEAGEQIDKAYAALVDVSSGSAVTAAQEFSTLLRSTVTEIVEQATQLRALLMKTATEFSEADARGAAAMGM